MEKFKVVTVGCSHSSYCAGTPWPVPLSKMIDADPMMAYSQGAGNEMNILKLRQLLDEFEPNLAIVQLTDPNRYVIGLDYASSYQNINFKNLTGSYNAMEVAYYTFNHTKNMDNLEKLLKTNFHPDVDKFIINHVIPSEYNLYHKVIHTVCAMESLARSYNTPIVFFSWNVDLYEIIKNHGYEKALENFMIIPNYIENFLSAKGLKRLINVPAPASGHHGTENHVVIAKDYILPYLLSKNLIPGR